MWPSPPPLHRRRIITEGQDLSAPTYFDFEPRGLLEKFASVEEIEAASSSFSSFYSRGKNQERGSAHDQYDDGMIARDADDAGTSACDEGTSGDNSGAPSVKGPWSAD